MRSYRPVRHRLGRIEINMRLAIIIVSLGLLLGINSAAFAQGALTFTDINPDQSTLDPSDPDGASGGRINGLASVAGDNQVFYAASEWGGLYKSTDTGRTWFRLDRHLPTATRDVEVDPGDTERVYATSWYDGRINSLAGINVSTDGGNTWTHPATATPPVGLCTTARRTEPSAFGISIDPDNPRNVYIGTNCGLAISNDFGVTWNYLDPSGGTFVRNVWDVVVHNGGIIDLCGDNGHWRSTTSGATWTTGTGLPSGTCSIDVSPHESDVVFVTVGRNIYESDNGGTTWTNLGTPDSRRQGRIPFVATNARSSNTFDLWFGDVRLFSGACQSSPAGGGLRCPMGTVGPIPNPAPPTPANWSGPFTRSAGGHDDVGDIVFDTESTNNACPVLFSSDGGVYFNTIAASPNCHTPVWEQPQVTPHGLWLYGMAGVDQAGIGNEDLYFGAQDNGAFASTNASVVSPANPTWNNQACCDGFDDSGDPGRVLYTVCCGGGRANQLLLANQGMIGGSAISANSYPPDGLLPGFIFPDIIDRFGTDQYVLLTRDCNTPPDGIDNNGDGNIDEIAETRGCSGVNGGDGGVFITNNIGANPIIWTELGPTSEPPSNGVCAVQTSASAGIPTFYVQVGACNGNTADQLWRFTGTNPAGIWQQVTPPAGGIGIFAVDPNNPDRLYASNVRAGGPQMIHTRNGGTTWINDTELDDLMTGDGAFKYQTLMVPPSSAAGYMQPSLVAFDPEDSNILVAGGRDSGVFISDDGGNNWTRATDPINSGASGIPHLPRPWFAYFDHETGDPQTVNVYIGTRGRGVWRINFEVIQEPQIQVPGDVYLGDYCVGRTKVETLEVCNTGKEDLFIDGITSSSTDFEVTTPSSGYPVVISHDFCFPFEVVSTPATTGPLAGTLTITSNDPVNPSVEVDVTGTGMECVPQIQVPGDIHLSDYCVDDTKVETLEVCNTGKENLTVSPITSDHPDVTVTPPSSGYPVIISPDFCFPFEVVHTSTGPGPLVGHLTIPSDDPNNPMVEVDITGAGNVPDIRVTGSTDFGITSAWRPEERTVAVCNVGQCDLSVLSATVDCADFSLPDNPFPVTLGVAGCMDLVVQFTPELPGEKICELTITSDDPDTPEVKRTLKGSTPPAISFHTGFTHPYGHLNNVAGIGPTFNLGFVYPFRPRLAWDVRLGYANFDGSGGRVDRDVWSVGANIKYTVNPAAPVQVFLNGGPDLFHFDPGDVQFGFNVGLGLRVPVNKIFSVEATYNYYNAFTASPLLHFDLFQLGFTTSF